MFERWVNNLVIVSTNAHKRMLDNPDMSIPEWMDCTWYEQRLRELITEIQCMFPEKESRGYASAVVALASMIVDEVMDNVIQDRKYHRCDHQDLTR